MHRPGRRALLAAVTVAGTTAALLLGTPTTAGAVTGDTGVLRTVSLSASKAFPTSQKLGTSTRIQKPELRPHAEGDAADGGLTPQAKAGVISPTGVPVVAATPVSGSPGLVRSFRGLNGFEERFANNGNQFSVEPPDQALCVGNGYVFEAVNTVLRVYRPSGAAASAVTDLNTFYGYPAAFDRTTGRIGPEITDPTCLFDNATRRWFVTVVTLEVKPTTGELLGPNHLDVAVSKTANPLDGFRIYRLPLQDDGTQHTPKHVGCPCVGDYPHIATDANAFFATTNEFPLTDSGGVFSNGFNGAQVYAFDKAAMARGAHSLNVVQFAHTGIPQAGHTVPGFTLAPAQVPGTAYRTSDNGTEYFLSSIAAFPAQPQGYTGQANAIGVYSVTNTKSISSAHPALSLSGALRPSERYVDPPFATQKPGPTPLANFCSVTDCFGFGPNQASEGPVATGDSRMMQVYLAHGQLYGALTTGVQVSGRLQSGVAWFVVTPGSSPSTSGVAHQGYIGVANQNLNYPAVAALATGTGAVAFTLTGPAYYPSAAYSLVGTSGVTGAVHLAAAGVGPQDGFSEYAPDSATDPFAAPRPRWGDYGAAVPVGSTIWLGSEYIAQSCNFATFQRDPTCGGTRAPLMNWATRISAVTP